MLKLIVDESARREIKEIAGLYTSLAGPGSARKITKLILDTLQRLRSFPLSGPKVRDIELSQEGYRYVIAGKYICLYRVLADTVYVYHIVHGTSDYPTMMKRNYTLDSELSQ